MKNDPSNVLQFPNAEVRRAFSDIGREYLNSLAVVMRRSELAELHSPDLVRGMTRAEERHAATLSAMTFLAGVFIARARLEENPLSGLSRFGRHSIAHLDLYRNTHLGGAKIVALPEIGKMLQKCEESLAGFIFDGLRLEAQKPDFNELSYWLAIGRGMADGDPHTGVLLPAVSLILLDRKDELRAALEFEGRRISG